MGIGLLIGVNTPKALEPWKIINSVGSGPYADKTLSDCVMSGPLSSDGSADTYTTANKISVKQ